MARRGLAGRGAVVAPVPPGPKLDARRVAGTPGPPVVQSRVSGDRARRAGRRLPGVADAVAARGGGRGVPVARSCSAGPTGAGGTRGRAPGGGCVGAGRPAGRGRCTAGPWPSRGRVALSTLAPRLAIRGGGRPGAHHRRRPGRGGMVRRGRGRDVVGRLGRAGVPAGIGPGGPMLDESTVPISSLQLVSFQTQAPAGIIERRVRPRGRTRSWPRPTVARWSRPCGWSCGCHRRTRWRPPPAAAAGCPGWIARWPPSSAGSRRRSPPPACPTRSSTPTDWATR